MSYRRFEEVPASCREPGQARGVLNSAKGILGERDEFLAEVSAEFQRSKV